MLVKVCSPLGRHKQGDTGTAATSGHGTSRSRSRGGGRSCRGGVEEAAETKPNLCSLSTSGGWKSDNWVASLGCGEPSQEQIGELKSVLGHSRVLSYSMLLLVRCAEVIRLIR